MLIAYGFIIAFDSLIKTEIISIKIIMAMAKFESSIKNSKLPLPC